MLILHFFECVAVGAEEASFDDAGLVGYELVPAVAVVNLADRVDFVEVKGLDVAVVE